MTDLLDDFAGAGGWDEAARTLGLSSIGVDNDLAACQTAELAGHARILADVTTTRVTGTRGYVASPPCPDFSTAGLGLGELGPSGHLARWPLTRLTHLSPEWICLEQVPRVLPIWQTIGRDLTARGWSVWTGLLDAADYGVPQNRRRAILIGSRFRDVAPPTPTHAADAENLLDLPRHRTLADVLDLTPGWSYDSGQNSAAAGGTIVRYVRSCDRPAGTLTTKAASQWNLSRGDDHRRLTIADAAALQTFRPDYPWQGTREQQLRQIGNAVPPLLALHVLAAATGLPAPSLTCVAVS